VTGVQTCALPILDLELDEAGDLLLGGHACLPSGWCGPTPWAMTRLHCGVRTQILATWLNPSSTGVSRPKMDTRTLSFWASTLISEIEAGSVSNGPSVTVTDSPTSKSTWTGALPGVAAAAAPAAG